MAGREVGSQALGISDVLVVDQGAGYLGVFSLSKFIMMYAFDPCTLCELYVKKFINHEISLFQALNFSAGRDQHPSTPPSPSTPTPRQNLKGQ